MKILKANKGGIFLYNSSDMRFQEYIPKKKQPDLSTTLRSCHDYPTDYEFLIKYFHTKHPIFVNFAKSFFFVIKDETD